jgi:hypothetical protein
MATVLDPRFKIKPFVKEFPEVAQNAQRWLTHEVKVLLSLNSEKPMEEVVQKNSKKRRSFEKLLQDFLDDVTGSDEENMSQIQVEPEMKASVVNFGIKIRRIAFYLS